ncbi:hypothetical protein PRK78_005411 [Emydomyces testavorans]|uniref:Copper-fist domain-containing protein n=1 Tax=Emydomyces testavorans TaxID=2070801 RepID=A0AAF0DKH7_9EURO|nr:hypothetical protein PRK78_005411 [Emydomyces testavorans]
MDLLPQWIPDSKARDDTQEQDSYPQYGHTLDGYSQLTVDGHGSLDDAHYAATYRDFNSHEATAQRYLNEWLDHAWRPETFQVAGSVCPDLQTRDMTRVKSATETLASNAIVAVGAPQGSASFQPGISTAYRSSLYHQYELLSHTGAPNQLNQSERSRPDHSQRYDAEIFTAISLENAEDLLLSDLHDIRARELDASNESFSKTSRNAEVTGGSHERDIIEHSGDCSRQSSALTKPIPIKPETPLSAEDSFSSPVPHATSSLSSSARSGISIPNSHYKRGSARPQPDDRKRPTFTVWDSVSGLELPAPARKRQRTKLEKWKTAMIRELGGACADCKRNHRSCSLEHLLQSSAKIPKPGRGSTDRDILPSLSTSYETVSTPGSFMTGGSFSSTPHAIPSFLGDDLSEAGGQFMQYGHLGRSDALLETNMSEQSGNVQELYFNKTQEPQDQSTGIIQSSGLSQLFKSGLDGPVAFDFRLLQLSQRFPEDGRDRD